MTGAPFPLPLPPPSSLKPICFRISGFHPAECQWQEMGTSWWGPMGLALCLALLGMQQETKPISSCSLGHHNPTCVLEGGGCQGWDEAKSIEVASTQPKMQGSDNRGMLGASDMGHAHFFKGQSQGSLPEGAEP